MASGMKASLFEVKSFLYPKSLFILICLGGETTFWPCSHNGYTTFTFSLELYDALGYEVSWLVHKHRLQTNGGARIP